MSQTSTRNRTNQSNTSSTSFKFWNGPVLGIDLKDLCWDFEIQRTISQGNPFGRKNRLHKKFVEVYGYDPTGSQDIGGPFTTFKVESRASPLRDFNLTGGNPVGPHYTYEGRCVAWSNRPNFTSGDFLQPSSASVLDSYGTTAISRCIPTNPIAGMGQFLGEIRDLPKIPVIGTWKKIIKDARRKTKGVDFDNISRGAADDLLNSLFGWVPFISDLKKFEKTAREAGPLMEKFAKGANKLFHRSYYFPDETTTSVSVLSQNAYPVPSTNTTLWTTGGVLTKTSITTTKRWFKGAFTYHLPPIQPGDNQFVQTILKWKYAEASANKLYGLRINPDLLYNLTPWSWALDWATNAGDVVHNWSSFASDGLVMDYGYIMETKIRHDTYSLVGCTCSAGKQTFVQEFVYTTKTRRRATPYGFGVNPASFTARQWSIIAALGISKQPLSLNF